MMPHSFMRLANQRLREGQPSMRVAHRAHVLLRVPSQLDCRWLKFASASQRLL